MATNVCSYLAEKKGKVIQYTFTCSLLAMMFVLLQIPQHEGYVVHGMMMNMIVSL